jgi:DNA-binding helix-hairpin-helix protein with protein kinase domain
MRRKPRGRHECVAYLGERVAEALAHAHYNGIVHGDIKPSNILLSGNGEPLLMDFNLSGDAGQSILARGGTMPYMPPEQLQSVLLNDSDGRRYDARSDIYSLGIVLYEALTGRSPFPLEDSPSDFEQLAELLLARQRQGCVPLRSIDQTVSASLAQAIEQCLEFRPDDRPSSAAELQSLFERESRIVKRARRHVGRHAGAYGFVGLAIIILLAASVIYVANLPPRQVRRFQEAIALQEAGELKAAEAKLSQALAIEPTYTDAKFSYARTALLQKDIRRAQ